MLEISGSYQYLFSSATSIVSSSSMHFALLARYAYPINLLYLESNLYYRQVRAVDRIVEDLKLSQDLKHW
jgi:hypothetical protein